jgi:ABC-type multidrug transport system fused ATPase/permease subunit
LRHIVAYLLFNMVMGSLLVGGTFVGYDLWFNKALNGEPLESVQTVYLLLDESYSAQGDESKELTYEQRETVLNRILLGATIVALLLIASYVIGGTYQAWIYQRINQGLRTVMIRRVEHLSLQYHAHSRTGDMIYRVYQDSATITNVLQTFVVTPLRAVGTALISTVVLMFFSPWLGLMLLVTFVPLIWLIVRFTPRLQTHARQARQRNSNLTANIQEVFEAIKLIKANSAEAHALREFDQESNSALDAAFAFRWDIILLTTSLMVISVSVLLFAEYWMAGWSRAEDATYLGGVVGFVGFAVWNLGAFQTASVRLADTNHHTNDVASLWSAAQDLAVGLDRAFDLLDLKATVIDAPDAQAFPEVVREVSWRDVNFSYGEHRVVNNLNLQAASGTITAIVGTTGAGKSTLMTLLLRLYDPDSGGVWINDVNVKDIAIADLRANIAIALQQNMLFTESIAQNIAYARPDATRAEIERAAQLTCAHDFILNMPEGYDAELGERGGKLSTGQRQRLSIARAVVRDTPILILDEPTASLDAATEHQVLENLRVWGRNRVVFLITHRLSTIRNADQIAFLADGAIAELGSHDALINRSGGLYRQFVQADTVGTAVDE